MKKTVWIVALFLFLALLVYGGSLRSEFVSWDDGMLIYENPVIREISPSSLLWIFTHFDPELYIPLTFFSYQIDYLIGGIDPFVFHLQNLLWHTANALLVAGFLFLLLRQKGIALFCGLVFLLHPLHTEAVLWASARKDVLSTFFFLLSISTYLLYRKQGERRLYGASILLFLGGLLSKVMVITLPVVLILIDRAQGRKIDRASLQEKLPYFLLSVLLGLVGILGKTGVLASSSVGDKILMAGKSTFFYLQLFFWPSGLSLLYPYSGDITITSPDFFLPLAGILAVLAGTAWLWKHNRLAASGMLFFFITVAPTLLNFAKGGDGDIYIASDRYAYVPSIGLLLTIAALLVQWIEASSRRISERLWQGVGGVLLLLLAMLSYRQSLVWTDTRTLFENVIRHSPTASYIAHNNLGNMYRLQGEFDRAIEEYGTALAIRPHAYTLSNLGAAYRRKQMPTEARAAYEEALTLDPESPVAHAGLAILLAERGERVAAELHYRKAIAFRPQYKEAYVNLGALYAAEGAWAKAAEAYGQALAINPYFPDAQYNAAIAYTHLGRTADAIAAYERVIDLDPTSIAARINLGVLYHATGERSRAIRQFQIILQIDPGNATARSALQQMDL